MGRPDLADWKTKICLIIVPKQVEEKVSPRSCFPESFAFGSFPNCVLLTQISHDLLPVPFPGFSDTGFATTLVETCR